MAQEIGIRRWGDRCFHFVEEELEDGYIVEGIFIDKDDVVDTRRWDDDGPGCGSDRTPASE